jgi:hypothetical protein
MVVRRSLTNPPGSRDRLWRRPPRSNGAFPGAPRTRSHTRRQGARQRQLRRPRHDHASPHTCGSTSCVHLGVSERRTWRLHEDGRVDLPSLRRARSQPQRRRARVRRSAHSLPDAQRLQSRLAPSLQPSSQPPSPPSVPHFTLGRHEDVRREMPPFLTAAERLLPLGMQLAGLRPLGLACVDPPLAVLDHLCVRH